jgi:hypothetical protein
MTSEGVFTCPVIRPATPGGTGEGLGEAGGTEVGAEGESEGEAAVTGVPDWCCAEAGGVDPHAAATRTASTVADLATLVNMVLEDRTDWWPGSYRPSPLTPTLSPAGRGRIERLPLQPRPSSLRGEGESSDSRFTPTLSPRG